MKNLWRPQFIFTLNTKTHQKLFNKHMTASNYATPGETDSVNGIWYTTYFLSASSPTSLFVFEPTLRGRRRNYYLIVKFVQNARFLYRTSELLQRDNWAAKQNIPCCSLGGLSRLDATQLKFRNVISYADILPPQTPKRS